MKERKALAMAIDAGISESDRRKTAEALAALPADRRGFRIGPWQHQENA